MQTRMMIENPDNIELTIKITMKTKEWDIIRNQLDEKTSEGWYFAKAITEAFSQIRKIVYINQNEK